MRTLDLLRTVYVSELAEGGATTASVSEAVDDFAADIRKEISNGIKRGLLKRVGRRLELTERGRRKLKVVMVGGAFEIIHPGHVYMLGEARKLGNTLVVVVATDETVAKNKRREPVTNQAWRVRLASQIRLVDIAVPGGHGSIYDTLERVKPDIVALGYDQFHNPDEIVNEASKRGIRISVVRLDSPLPTIKTSKIVEGRL